jgi:hypothetical protein
MNAIRHGRELGQPRVRRHRLSIGTPPPPPTLDQRVKAIIGSTKGFALDPFDFSTLFANSDGTGAISAVGQTVGKMLSKWGSVPVSLSQSVAASRPLTNAEGLLFDGVSDHLNGDAPFTSFYANLPALFFCQRLKLASIPAASVYVNSWARSASNIARHTTAVGTTGQLTVGFNRVDSGNLQSVVSPNPISVSTLITTSFVADFAGTSGSKLWINGSLVDTDPNPPPPGANSEASISRRGRIGAGPGSTAIEFWNGVLGKAVFLPFIPSDADRTTIEAWVSA